jgi:hypothetical protein
MADFVPGNIIQTPDFGRMAQGYVQQYRQEEAAKNQFLNEFDKKEGLYLEGYKPAVQESWNNVQSVMDMVAQDDTPENRRKLKEAYGEYSTAAGTAQYLSNEYRQNIAAYKADPTKFAVGSDEFLNLTEDYKLRKRSRNELLDEVNNPFFLQRSIKYDLLNPYDQAKVLLSDSRMKISDFYNDEGQLNRSALRAYAEKRARAQVNADPQNLDKAAAWGGIREGYAGGEDGVITTPQELEFIQSQDEETKNSFIDKYVNELATNYVDLVAEQLKTKGKDGKDLLKLLPYESSRAAVPGVGDIEGVDFQAFAKPLSGTLKNAIGFGVDPMGRYLVEEVVEREVRSGRTKQKKKESVIREANPSEIAQITNALSKDYGLTISEKSVSSQEDPLGIR